MEKNSTLKLNGNKQKREYFNSVTDLENEVLADCWRDRFFRKIEIKVPQKVISDLEKKLRLLMMERMN